MTIFEQLFLTALVGQKVLLPREAFLSEFAVNKS